MSLGSRMSSLLDMLVHRATILHREMFLLQVLPDPGLMKR